MPNRRQFLKAIPAAAALSFRSFAAPRLKIAAVKAARLRGLNSRFVRVYTDQGLTGTGETLDTVGAEDIINHHLGPAVIGRDPLDIESIWYDLWSWQTPPGGIPPEFMRGMGGPYLSALSGLEMALWDVAGKALGVPIYRLLGGRVRDKVAVYFHVYDPAQAADVVRTTGVKAVKAVRLDAGTEEENPAQGLDPGKRFDWTLANRQIDAFAERVAAIRKAIGPDIGPGPRMPWPL
jgi:galactonate dehydratase